MKLYIYFMILSLLLLSSETLIYAAPTSTVMVQMRDGMKLATDIYHPQGDGPWPVIAMRTPYPRTGGEEFTKLGYAIVIQSTRGRFGSEGGENLVFADDGWGKNQDGYDFIEWVKKQEWCNGKIGTYGGSAVGITQYMMAGSNPPSLTCQQVIMAPCSFYNQAMYQNGALREEQTITWLNANEFIADSIKIVRDNPANSEFWATMDLSNRFAEVNVPIMHIGGWYDTFQQGNIDAYTGIQKYGGPNARGKQKLIIGPYGHGVLGKFAEAEFPDPMPKFEIFGSAWYDYWLKGEGKLIPKLPNVMYYTMGAVNEPGAPGNIWKSSDVWPVKAKNTPYYLYKNSRLDVKKQSDKNAKLTYKYDPANPVPTIGGNNLTIPSGPMDQRKVEDRDDVLIFTSDVLDESVEVTGRIKAVLWISSSAKDTDFTAKLTDVYPDGRSMLICDGIIRAKYHNSLAKPEYLQQGKIYKIEIDLWSTSMIFNKGHKIRLAISSSNSTRFEANTNSDKPNEKIIAENSIYMDRKHPSALYLPIISETKVDIQTE